MVFGIFDPVGVGLLAVGMVVAVIGLLDDDRIRGWTVTGVGVTLMGIVLY